MWFMKCNQRLGWSGCRECHLSVEIRLYSHLTFYNQKVWSMNGITFYFGNFNKLITFLLFHQHVTNNNQPIIQPFNILNLPFLYHTETLQATSILISFEHGLDQTSRANSRQPLPPTATPRRMAVPKQWKASSLFQAQTPHEKDLFRDLKTARVPGHVHL